jgi:uncharacterized protein YegP (UPF0339 family)
MAGSFELRAADGGVRILLVNGMGNVLAVSGRYGDKEAAAAGVTAIREHAATAYIKDRTGAPEVEGGLAPPGILP